jgi:hypothetical protein
LPSAKQQHGMLKRGGAGRGSAEAGRGERVRETWHYPAVGCSKPTHCTANPTTVSPAKHLHPIGKRQTEAIVEQEGGTEGKEEGGTKVKR